MNNFLSLIVITTLLIQSVIYTPEISSINNEEIIAEIASSGENVIEENTVEKEIEWQVAKATAYCSCTKCCGPNAKGITASGVKAKANHTIAMSKEYPFGTQIEIENMGIYTVEDRSGAITGNRIDIYFASHSEALAFGTKTLKFRVIQK